MPITDSDRTRAYEPFESCKNCGTTTRNGKCPVCDEDYFYEEDRAWREETERRATEDALDVMKEIHRNNAAFLDMTPWDIGLPAVLRRQAD